MSDENLPVALVQCGFNVNLDHLPCKATNTISTVNELMLLKLNLKF